jgi:ATP-binding cassette subfamily C protein
MRLHTFAELFRKSYSLARPYGRRRLAIVFLWVLAQGIMQVVGVTSIFPFLAIAAAPDRLRESEYGARILALLPPIDNSQLLLLSGLGAIALLLVSNAINLASEVARVHYAHSFGHWMRLRLLRQIASQPWSFFLANNSSVLIKKVAGDVNQYVQGVLLPLLDSIARLLTVLLLLGLIFVVNPTIALSVGGVLGGFYALVLFYLNRRMNAVSEGLKVSGRGLARETTQLITGIKPIKLRGVEDFFIRRFGGYSLDMGRLYSRIPIYSNGPRYLVEPMAFGGLVGIVLFRVVAGEAVTDILPVLGVLAIAGYRLIPALQLLYGQITQLTTTTYALDEVYDEFVNAERAVLDDNGPATPARPLPWEDSITLENITFSYPQAESPVLRDISVTIPRNSCVAFIGKTGCGKSTLLDVILGLHRPSSGRILVDGKPLTPGTFPAWRAAIGYVPQDIFLIDDTISANVALGIDPAAVDHDQLRNACRMAQILDFIETELPGGFQTVVGERGVRLSGGQRQRLGLARALYSRPNILILDEATSALDQTTEKDINQALDALKGQLTILIVTHRLSSITSGTQVYSIRSGELTPESGELAGIEFADGSSGL